MYPKKGEIIENQRILDVIYYSLLEESDKLKVKILEIEKEKQVLKAIFEMIESKEVD